MKYTVSESEFTCTRDNLVIRGTQYIPYGTAKYPIIVVSHGFMDSQGSTKPYAKKLAELGYVTLAFDFCGGGIRGISDGRTQDMTVFTEVEDLKQVIEYAKTIEEADPEHITLMGFSQGGFVSMLTAAELGSHKIEQLIPIYPALCIPDDARRGRMMFAKFDPTDIPEEISCGPMKLGRSYPESVLYMDPYEVIGRYAGKVLIIHGTADKVVDIDYSRRAAACYKDSDDVSLHIIEGAGHGFNKEYDAYAMEVVEQWLEGAREILTIDVELRDVEVLEKGIEKSVIAIPFSGRAESEYFSGIIQPGARDTQQLEKMKAVDCCADYDIVGRDCAGERCTVHVINRRKKDGPWTPAVTTDSKALDFLNGADLHCVFENRRKGPKINIFAKQ